MAAVSMMLIQPSEAANWGSFAKNAGKWIKGTGKKTIKHTDDIIRAGGGSSRKEPPVIYSTCGACRGAGRVIVGYNYYGQPVIHQCPQCGGSGRIWLRNR